MTLECGLYSKGGNVKANVVKKGAGTLQLAAKGKAAMYNNDTYGDVYVNFSVEEGALKFYQGSDLDKTMRARSVDVAQGAVCWLPIRKKMQIGDLCGSGLVTNDYAAASGVNLGLCGHGSFFGEICGNFGVLVEAGRTDLWGENNSWASETQISQGAVLGLKRIGDATSGGSAGRSAISIRAGAGGIVYLGSGETFSRDFWSRNRHDRDFVFDAGACGGLDMLGSFTLTSWRESAHMGLYHLKLTGSNTTEAVLSGDIQSYSFDEDNYALFSVTKDGTGTWYLKDIPGGRSFSGVVEVRNGTLKFDSVAEKGVKTSLGTANDLSSQKTGYPRDRDKDEDYAYVLGGGETPGVMEFVGGENCRTTTRPVVLNGIGALVNNSAGSELRIRGVSAMNAGAKTLVLGGASTMENVVWDVTDGEGTVSVEKRGSGSWTLGGASSFSGNLTVKEGTLIVRNDKGAPYKWFKLVIKETASSNPELKPGLTFTDQIGLVEWGLYDGEGRRVNKITNSADGYDLPFETLRPAQIAFTGKPA
jgi:autotransporter-associated beta strand protein